MSNEIEYASRIEPIRAHHPLKTSAKAICERLGDRRSPKIIRVVRPLTRTRSLRNCEIVVRNTSPNIPRNSPWILHDRNSIDAPFKLTLDDKISERFRRAEGAINRFVLWPPDFRFPFPHWKTNFPPSKNSKVLRYLLPLPLALMP